MGILIGIANDLMRRAHELKSIFTARATETENKRAPLIKTIDDLCNSDFLQIPTPKRYGDHELQIDTLIAVSSINASGCPSTGWVTAFYIGRNWFHSVFPQKSQDEVLAERPYQPRSTQIAPTLSALKVAGGYEITEQQS